PHVTTSCRGRSRSSLILLNLPRDTQLAAAPGDFHDRQQALAPVPAQARLLAWHSGLACKPGEMFLGRVQLPGIRVGVDAGWVADGNLIEVRRGRLLSAEHHQQLTDVRDLV